MKVRGFDYGGGWRPVANGGQRPSVAAAFEQFVEQRGLSASITHAQRSWTKEGQMHVVVVKQVRECGA